MSLLAKALLQSTSLSNVKWPSRAGSLPHLIPITDACHLSGHVALLRAAVTVSKPEGLRCSNPSRFRFVVGLQLCTRLSSEDTI
ncbi:hypothetical protein PspCFBP13508_18790 [Pseudomonas sp. CFBP13508]|nr:hypothetical protein PspCFBP13508_18790 [Pseudomonas sp. CFBP13508]